MHNAMLFLAIVAVLMGLVALANWIAGAPHKEFVERPKRPRPPENR